MRALVPVILSGGAGTRLWPVSREALPKPFIKLPDGGTLLSRTLQRATALPGVARVVTVTNRDYYFLTRDEYQAAGLDVASDFLLEPVSRNTAAAVCAAALHAARAQGPEAVLLVLPADQLIRDQSAFAEAVAEALRLADEGWLVTFGIAPTAPETGFGYIEAGAALGERAAKASRFVEKPDLETARGYLATGRFAWNAGIFCFRARAALEAFGHHAPQLLAAVEATLAASDLAKEPVVLAKEAFAQVPDVSFDVAVMEKAAVAVGKGRGVAVVRGRFDWSDVGSWNALAALREPDAQGNRVDAEAVLVDARDCYVQSQGRVVAAVGVEGLVIVDTPDALLVARRERVQDVKAVVQKLKLTSHATVTHHRTVQRPWGSFTVLEEGARFKMKRIVVKRGASLSLQLHHHRSEHWVVVSGTAKVVNGERETFVHANESTYIAAGTKHRLSNPGVIDCVMIEVQVGDYLGEDDIVRFEDSYGRS